MNKEKGSVSVILIVLVIVFAAAVIYFAFIKKSGPISQSSVDTGTTQAVATQPTNNPASTTSPRSTSTATVSAAQPISSEVSSKSIVQTKSGYEVGYPSNWVVVSQSESVNYGSFEIKNSSNAVLPGANSVMGSGDSYIAIQTSYGTLPNGINYGNYATIDDIIKDPKFGTPASQVQAKLAEVTPMNIGGKELRVLTSSNATSIGYSFVYGGKSYNISFTAGSKAQYEADYPTFTNILSSFKLL